MDLLLSDDPNVNAEFEMKESHITANWPTDCTVKVCLTFDTQGAIDGLKDGYSYQTTTTQEDGSPNWWDYSERQYGIPCALTRILDILDEQDVEATFPTCGQTAEWYPDEIRKIAERGHEVANHSHSHELFYKLDEEEQIQEVEKATEVLEDVTGTHPEGWRSPAFTLTKELPKILEENDYLWDSSLHNRDLPYVLSNGETDLVELPAGHIDDWTLYLVSTSSNVGHMGGYPRGTPGGVLDVLTSELDRLHEEAVRYDVPRVFMYTMHPKISGRPHRAKALAEFIDRAKQKPGVQFATCSEIAALASE